MHEKNNVAWIANSKLMLTFLKTNVLAENSILMLTNKKVTWACEKPLVSSKW